ncbi:hypothetical protein FSP39_012846 [Pinctada imbricata]|uniref:protein-tyrosine-phosphatase n=1 Tax=Pinctada imbricata TaxID=66713 RepID=A0AA89BT00_PINIB|nr:hypothetical protein FSP39_012846 [Pinctada imbricata]
MKEDKEAKLTSSFDSSDEDDKQEEDRSPLKIAWFDQSDADEVFGICALPECLRTEEVKDIFCLCSKGELNKYRVPDLLTSLAEADITVHHYHFPDGETPPTQLLISMLDELKVAMKNKRKPVVHCYGGLGRSCLVASCLLMILDTDFTPEEAISKMKEMRGPRAVQSVRRMREGVMRDIERQAQRKNTITKDVDS